MRDTDKRNRERQAALGDTDARDALTRDAARDDIGSSRAAYYRSLIGQDVYIQGARLNYLGVPSGVLLDCYGEPCEVLMSRCVLVGEWERSGPTAQYCMNLPCEPRPYAIAVAGIEAIGPAMWPAGTWPR